MGLHRSKATAVLEQRPVSYLAGRLVIQEIGREGDVNSGIDFTDGIETNTASGAQKRDIMEKEQIQGRAACLSH